MSRNPKVELLYFPGCPNVGTARKNLERALQAFSLAPIPCPEVNIRDPGTTEEYRYWPSPVLIDGKDVEGKPPAGATTCRIYEGGRGPRFERILAALKEANER